jgi:hypothetical protein
MTIKPSQTETYQHVSEALAANGYDDCGTMYGPCNPVTGVEKKYSVYKNEATGKFYTFAGMENFNTQIFSISLKPVDIDRLTDYSWKE